MSNIAVIFAAGHGIRMNNPTPKQYLMINNKPILAYTIDVFESSSLIDKIILVTLKEKIEYTQEIIKKYKYKKIIGIVAGGETALDSQFNGLQFLKDNQVNDDDIILIHDGVRPLISNHTIENAIKLTEEKGNAITVSPASETISLIGELNEIDAIMPRESCLIVRAPQVFYFKDIYDAHLKRRQKQLSFVDSASMMKYFHHKLHIFYGPIENIKVTTENDYIVCEHFLMRKNNGK